MKLKPYRGFEGAVTSADPETNMLSADVTNVDAVIQAQASSPAQLQREWEASVDVYLEMCGERGVEPMKPFYGCQ
jgi:predicted HicB family RNase H-like nuclease